MRLFLASLAVLFGSSLIGYVSIRLLGVDETVQMPALPTGLWLSTVLMVVSSITMQHAVVAVRRGRIAALRAELAATTALAIAFLVVQAVCWAAWAAPMRAAIGQTEQRFLLTAFYVLTGLHALHVIGGLVSLIIINKRAAAGRYSIERHAGIVYTAMYWHFLDGMWLVIFVTLLIGT
jgi:cytochrome c oxidase subunit 3